MIDIIKCWKKDTIFGEKKKVRRTSIATGYRVAVVGWQWYQSIEEIRAVRMVVIW
jgi:uncharacterized protein YbaA (DUF1428 family)